MKKSILWMLAAILTCGLLTTACSTLSEEDNPSGYVGGGDIVYDLNDVELIDSGYITFKDIIKDVIDDHSEVDNEEDAIFLDWGRSQYEIIAKEEANAQTRNLTRGDSGEGLDGENGSSYWTGLKWVTIRYKTVGADGKENKLSELIVYPNDPKKFVFKNVIIGCHCTITSDKERPTNFSKLSFQTDVNMLTVLAGATSSLVVIPDYEGYGATKDQPHPYLNREVTARQVIDGVKAGVKWYEANVSPLEKGFKSVAVGYSQGGAVAASAVRYYHEHLEKGLSLIGAVCGDGPYDPLATLKQYISENKLYMPAATAMLLKGVIDTNKDLKALGCCYQDFVTDKFYETGIFDLIQAKNLDNDEILKKLLDHSAKNGGEKGGFTMMAWNDGEFRSYDPANIVKYTSGWDLSNGNAKNYCTVEECFKPGVIAYFKNNVVGDDVEQSKMEALEKALKENALTYGTWKPNNDTQSYIFFHSTRDEIVPFCNYESVKNGWGIDLMRGFPYQAPTYLHIGTGAHFFVHYATKYTETILSQKWEYGEETIYRE